MPRLVNIPGKGQVAFPDYMTDAQVTQAIEEDILKPAPTMLEKAGTVATDVLQPTAEGIVNAWGQMGQGLHTIIPEGPIDEFKRLTGMGEPSAPPPPQEPLAASLMNKVGGAVDIAHGALGVMPQVSAWALGAHALNRMAQPDMPNVVQGAGKAGGALLDLPSQAYHGILSLTGNRRLNPDDYTDPTDRAAAELNNKLIDAGETLTTLGAFHGLTKAANLNPAYRAERGPADLRAKTALEGKGIVPENIPSAEEASAPVPPERALSMWRPQPYTVGQTQETGPALETQKFIQQQGRRPLAPPGFPNEIAQLFEQGLPAEEVHKVGQPGKAPINTVPRLGSIEFQRLYDEADAGLKASLEDIARRAGIKLNKTVPPVPAELVKGPHIPWGDLTDEAIGRMQEAAEQNKAAGNTEAPWDSILAAIRLERERRGATPPQEKPVAPEPPPQLPAGDTALHSGFSLPENIKKMFEDALNEVARKASEIKGPSKIPNDADMYKQLDAQQKQLRESGQMLGPDGQFSPTFKTNWQKMEDIKNKNGGMPPGQTAAPFKAETALGATPSTERTQPIERTPVGQGAAEGQKLETEPPTMASDEGVAPRKSNIDSLTGEIPEGEIKSKSGNSHFIVGENYSVLSDNPDVRKWWETDAKPMADDFDQIMPHLVGKRVMPFKTFVEEMQKISPIRPEQKVLFKILDSLDPEGKVILVNGIASKVTPIRGHEHWISVGGLYHSNSDKVYVSKQAAMVDNPIRVVLHEQVHKQSVRILDAVAARINRQPEAIAAFNKLIDLGNVAYKHFKKEGWDTSAYGFTHPTEFVTEGFTNPEFRGQLSEIPYGANPKMSVFSKFLEAIRQLLRIPEGQRTILDGLFDVTGDLAQMNKETVPLALPNAKGGTVIAAAKLGKEDLAPSTSDVVEGKVPPAEGVGKPTPPPAGEPTTTEAPRWPSETEMYGGLPIPREVMDKMDAGLKKLIDHFSPKEGGFGPAFVFRKEGQLPDFQPHDVAKEVFSRPTGIGKIPGIGALVDPRYTAKSPAEKAIIAWAAERSFGDTVATIVSESRSKDGNPLKVEDGKISNITAAKEGASLYPSDFIETYRENPSAYNLDPEQKAYVDKLLKVVDDTRALATKHGVLSEVENLDGERGNRKGFTFPRIVIDSGVTVDGKKVEPVLVGSRVGTKQWFQRQRLYPSEEVGAKTVTYEPDIEKRLNAYVSRVYRAIADKRLVEDPTLGGQLPGERIPELRAHFKEELASGQMTEADIRDLAHRPLLTHGEGTVSEPAFSGRIFPIQTANTINKYFGETSHRWMRNTATVNNTLKSLEFSLDLSPMVLQGQVLAFYKPKLWARSTANMFAALTNKDTMSQYLNESGNLAAAKELASLGVKLGRPYEFAAGAAKGELLTRLGTGVTKDIPVVGHVLRAAGKTFEAAGRSFAAYSDVAAIEMWKAMRDTVPKEQRVAVAETIQAVIARGRMEEAGISPARSLGERVLLLAPTFLRGTATLVANMAEKGVSGEVARRSLAAWGVGMTAAFMAYAYGTGMKEDEIKARLNPANSEFMSIPIEIGGKKMNVGLGGPFKSYLRLMGDITETAIRHPEDFATGSVERNPISRWLRGKLAPGPSLTLDTAFGKDFLGRPTNFGQSAAARVIPSSLQPLLRRPGEPETPVGGDVVPGLLGMQASPTSRLSPGARNILGDRARIADAANQIARGVINEQRPGLRYKLIEEALAEYPPGVRPQLRRLANKALRSKMKAGRRAENFAD